MVAWLEGHSRLTLQENLTCNYKSRITFGFEVLFDSIKEDANSQKLTLNCAMGMQESNTASLGKCVVNGFLWSVNI